SILTPANAALTWESSRTWNLGVDFGVLPDNRIRGSLDIYRKLTDNLIGEMEVNPLSGYHLVTGNFGNMRNSGFELALNSLNVSGQRFSWMSQLILAYNHNKITQLKQPVVISTGAQK